MDFFRVQDKIISWQKLEKTLKQALVLRSKGFSQQETAEKLMIDRTFISRMEGIGELRKGQTVACLGFPISNKLEIQELLEKEGVDFILLMTEEERLNFINQSSGKEMLNLIMDLTAKVRSYEIVICMGSDERIRLIERILDNQVITVELGKSPLTEDQWVDPREISKILRSIKASR
jgi:transcriptional regulator with XRE-family HTH domain